MARVLLAPMEGMVDAVMRDVLTRAAPYDWCVSEFVRVSNSVLPNRGYTRLAPELLAGARTAAGTPVRVQLLGADPLLMGACAARLARLRPAGIDLNFGCPSPLVNRHGSGAALLDQPEQIYRITQAVMTGIGGQVPLTAKMRLGVRDASRALEVAQALAEGGAELLVVHARTREEGYRPPAHWSWIARITEGVKIPVVANGEIWTVADYQRCVAESACSDVMLGRGAVADPLLAERIRRADQGQVWLPVAADWERMLPLLGHFWRGVLGKVLPAHAPGRLKQWLNLLRRTFPQAETLHQQVRPLREVAAVTALLTAAGAL